MQLRTGEPYQLADKRLVFTAWHFVRPGAMDWLDDQGNSTYSNRRVKHGPFESHFVYRDEPSGIRLVAEPAQRIGPVIRRDKPWEKMGLGVYTLIHEDGTYRMWGRCQDAGGESNACYFESADGETWERPELGLVPFDGNMANNLIPDFQGCVFRDPIAPAEERYRTVWEASWGDQDLIMEYKARRPASVAKMAEEWTDITKYCLLAAVSPDGYRWTTLPEPICIECSDTQIVTCYDERLKRYVMYTRNYMTGMAAEGYSDRRERWHWVAPRRAIGRTESEDFREFPASEVIIEPGADMGPSDTYYTNCKTTIPGAPDHHLLFPTVWHQAEETTSVEVHASYYGRVWTRIPGSPVLETSDFGRFDGGCIFASPNVVELPDGRWVLPYTGYAYPHKYPRGAWAYDIGMATWPKGRMIALDAQARGEFTTLSFVTPGTKLRINAVTKRSGSLRVEVLDFKGNPIPGRTFEDCVPLIGDHYRTLVAWKQGDDLGVEENAPVALRFRMDKAKIYGLDFE